MLLGFVSLIELLYSHGGSATDSMVSLFGFEVDAAKTMTWVVALVVFVVGIALFRWAWKFVREAWDQITPEMQARGVV